MYVRTDVFKYTYMYSMYVYISVILKEPAKANLKARTCKYYVHLYVCLS